jgi:hypothetical protein
VLIAAGASSLSAVRAEWFVEINPQTGAPQVLWSAPSLEPGVEDVSFSKLEGATWSPAKTFVATEYADETLSVGTGPDGRVHATWGTAGDSQKILMRTLPSPDADWGPEIELSAPGATATHPTLAAFATSVFVAWEEVSPSGAKSIICGKIESTGTVERSLVTTIPLGGASSPRLHVESDALWLDWLDSPDALGYSVWLNGAWQPATFEPYDGAADLDAARARVRARVLGG